MGTTNFESWLDQADPDTTETIYGLYEAVSSETTNGIWNVSKRGNNIIVQVGNAKDALIIASSEAKNVFLNLVRERYMDGDDDAESWYGFQRNMDNPKA
jgi:hypothetical protein